MQAAVPQSKPFHIFGRAFQHRGGLQHHQAHQLRLRSPFNNRVKMSQTNTRKVDIAVALYVAIFANEVLNRLIFDFGNNLTRPAFVMVRKKLFELFLPVCAQASFVREQSPVVCYKQQSIGIPRCDSLRRSESRILPAMQSAKTGPRRMKQLLLPAMTQLILKTADELESLVCHPLAHEAGRDLQ